MIHPYYWICVYGSFSRYWSSRESKEKEKKTQQGFLDWEEEL